MKFVLDIRVRVIFVDSTWAGDHSPDPEAHYQYNCRRLWNLQVSRTGTRSPACEVKENFDFVSFLVVNWWTAVWRRLSLRPKGTSWRDSSSTNFTLIIVSLCMSVSFLSLLSFQPESFPPIFPSSVPHLYISIPFFPINPSICPSVAFVFTLIPSARPPFPSFPFSSFPFSSFSTRIFIHVTRFSARLSEVRLLSHPLPFPSFSIYSLPITQLSFGRLSFPFLSLSFSCLLGLTSSFRSFFIHSFIPFVS